jgi:hypothetical protein
LGEGEGKDIMCIQFIVREGLTGEEQDKRRRGGGKRGYGPRYAQMRHDMHDQKRAWKRESKKKGGRRAMGTMLRGNRGNWKERQERQARREERSKRGEIGQYIDESRVERQEVVCG